MKGLYEGMVRAMKRVLMEEVALRAIREYHGLQEGVWEVEKKAEIEGVEGQETSLAQRIRMALGQAHEAQQKGNSALATQHHEGHWLDRPLGVAVAAAVAAPLQPARVGIPHNL